MLLKWKIWVSDPDVVTLQAMLLTTVLSEPLHVLLYNVMYSCFPEVNHD